MTAATATPLSFARRTLANECKPCRRFVGFANTKDDENSWETARANTQKSDGKLMEATQKRHGGPTTRPKPTMTTEVTERTVFFCLRQRNSQNYSFAENFYVALNGFGNGDASRIPKQIILLKFAVAMHFSHSARWLFSHRPYNKCSALLCMPSHRMRFCCRVHKFE